MIFRLNDRFMNQQIDHCSIKVFKNRLLENLLRFIFLGDLNTVAPIVTIFFLLAYAAVDTSCFILNSTSAPNFRPTFRYFNNYTCMLGIIGTVSMMVLVSLKFSTFAILVFIKI